MYAITSRCSAVRHLTRHGLQLGLPRHKHTVTKPDDPVDAARQWLKTFTASSIPTRICQLSFSRSSGPGGQNVNKVSSKATLRVELADLLPLVPSLLHAPLAQSPHYAKNSDSLVIKSDESRGQSENVDACFRKLHELILDTARQLVPGETSDSQKERVRRLQKADDERRLKMKKAHSQKKSARKTRTDD